MQDQEDPPRGTPPGRVPTPSPLWSATEGPRGDRHVALLPHASGLGLYPYAGVRWNRPVRDLAPALPLRIKPEAVVAYPDGHEEIWLASPDAFRAQVEAELAKHPGATLVRTIPSAAVFESGLPKEALLPPPPAPPERTGEAGATAT